MAHRAEVIDALRIIPRLMLLGFLIFYVIYIWIVTQWYFGLEEKEMGSTAFITSTITALGAMFAWVSKTYITTGREWTENKVDNK